MFDSLSKALPAASLVAVAIFSIFNIGYFWKIGLHFLGIVDFSNLVYSFGLALTFLFIFGSIAALILRRNLSRIRLIVTGAIGGAISLLGMFGSRTVIRSEFIENCVILTGFAITASVAVAWLWLRYKEKDRLAAADLAMLGVVVFGTIFQAGVFTSSLELVNKHAYSVSTQSGTIEGVRILRSSSAGFILSVDRKILFLPHSQIREIRSVFVLPE